MDLELSIMKNNDLIGIGFRSKVGKDLVANIIQGLTTADSHDVSDIDIDWINKYKCNSSYENVKFADKLKEIICLLTGCTREQLEDQKFKAKEMPKEWWHWVVDGFDFIYTDENRDPFINDIHEVFTNEEDAINFKNGFNKRDADLDIGLIKPTYREFLQKLGTDLLRDKLHPNTHVNALFSSYNDCNWIISDVRFENEANAIKSRGGILINIARPCIECRVLKGHCYGCSIGNIEHESEYSLDDYEGWDYVIQNTGSIDDLIKKVKYILIKEEIINE